MNQINSANKTNIILAVQLGHNSTAALGIDGEIVAVVSQEKIDNIKNSSAFPSGAILECLKIAHLNSNEITEIVVAGNNLHYSSFNESNLKDQITANDLLNFLEIYNSFLKRNIRKLYKFDYVKQPLLFLKEIIQRRENKKSLYLLKKRLNTLGIKTKNITSTEHHLCHARSALSSSNMATKCDQILVITVDGMGDKTSSSISTSNSNFNLKKIAETDISNSLGLIYSETTRFLGMKQMEHEYKVMGLAPYAKSYYLNTYNKIFKNLIKINRKNNLQLHSNIHTADTFYYLQKKAIGERFDNIAASVQKLTEEVIIKLVQNAIRKTSIKNICVGGGVFMNVKLNKRLNELNEINNIFFMPSCGDESNPIGAIYDAFYKKGIKAKPLKDLYLGRSYANSEIKSYLEEEQINDKFRVSFIPNIEEKIAELLADCKVVARFKGRYEWGARSLGNRAILGHPSFMKSFYEINDQIKVRDFWMPFAPSILKENADEYLENYNPNKYEPKHMINAYLATKKGRIDLIAAIHQSDKTLRPQIVTKEDNFNYHKLITYFKKATGIGGLLNTSFNLHGYPLVASPKQAFFTFKNSGLRYLAMENYLIEKTNSSF